MSTQIIGIVDKLNENYINIETILRPNLNEFYQRVLGHLFTIIKTQLLTLIDLNGAETENQSHIITDNVSKMSLDIAELFNIIKSKKFFDISKQKEIEVYYQSEIQVNKVNQSNFTNESLDLNNRFKYKGLMKSFVAKKTAIKPVPAGKSNAYSKSNFHNNVYLRNKNKTYKNVYNPKTTRTTPSKTHEFGKVLTNKALEIVNGKEPPKNSLQSKYQEKEKNFKSKDKKLKELPNDLEIKSPKSTIVLRKNNSCINVSSKTPKVTSRTKPMAFKVNNVKSPRNNEINEYPLSDKKVHEKKRIYGVQSSIGQKWDGDKSNLRISNDFPKKGGVKPSKLAKNLVKKYHDLVEQFNIQNPKTPSHFPSMSRSRSQIIKKKPVIKKLQVAYKPKKMERANSSEQVDEPPKELNEVRDIELIYDEPIEQIKQDEKEKEEQENEQEILNMQEHLIEPEPEPESEILGNINRTVDFISPSYNSDIILNDK